MSLRDIFDYESVKKRVKNVTHARTRQRARRLPRNRDLSHFTSMNESRHAYEWVMSHMWMRHVTHVDESCHAYEWVMSRLRMSHVTLTNESCHTYEWRFHTHTHLNRALNDCLANEIWSCHTWMSHVTHEWVMSHMNESCHTWMSHVTHEWVMSHMCVQLNRKLIQKLDDCLANGIWVMSHMTQSHHTYNWVTSHIWTSHVTHMNKSCHTYEWVMSHIWVSHVTHMCVAETWLHQKAERLPSKRDLSHVTHDSVRSHIWVSLVTYMNKSCHTYE